jgi:hypothetical protein
MFLQHTFQCAVITPWVRYTSYMLVNISNFSFETVRVVV